MRRKVVARLTELCFLIAAGPYLGIAAPQPNVAIRWNQAALQGVRDGTLGPPMVARALAIAHTCMYDAWATYDGSEEFGASITFPPGSSVIEPGITPSQTVTLHWNTFQEAANQAGISRRYGGIHFKTADLVGRAAGDIAGVKAWAKALKYFNDPAARRP